MYGDALTTVARIKERLTITATGFDALFTRLILSTTARIEAMTGRRFNLATYTNELHDGSDAYRTRRTFLIIKNAPVQTIASIEYKAGTNTDPDWTVIDADDYDVDLQNGIVSYPQGFPDGKQNIRVTYTGGFSGFTLGLPDFWVFNATPTGTVDGSNLTFTLPVTASQVIVTVDGLREQSSNVSFTAGTNTFTLATGRAPFSSIAVDYVRAATAEDGDYSLPDDLVDVCERAVVHLFKRRESEGKTSESFQESSITWNKAIFDDEMLATIKNYRRGYNL